MTPSDREPTGQRIARARRRRGLSQAVLAGLVGRSESWLSPAMHTVADTVICPGQPTVGCCPICPRNYLVLLLRPYVSQSNVLTRSSVILHVDMGLVPAGLARARGGGCVGQQRGCPPTLRSGLACAGRHNPLRYPPCTPGGKATAGASQDHPLSWIAHAARSPPHCRMGQTCPADGSAASNLVMHPRARLVGGVFPAARQSYRQLAKHIRRQFPQDRHRVVSQRRRSQWAPAA